MSSVNQLKMIVAQDILPFREKTNDLLDVHCQMIVSGNVEKRLVSLRNKKKTQLFRIERARFIKCAASQYAGENLTVGSVKVRLKNYASPDCGAKVVASNLESLSPGAILSPNRDDYMLNACNVKIWFVVELCEAIQPQRIEIANFELFSSSPKEFSIFVSDRFPTRDWSLVKSFTAKDERTVQSFPLPQLSHFAKYVKVELHSHYGTEHYCPISSFKAYGTSELEVLDNIDNDDNDDDVEVIHHSDTANSNARYDNDGTFKENNGKSNIYSDDSAGTEIAKAAVMSTVKKAVLVVKGGEKNGTYDGENFIETYKYGNRLRKYCYSPAYLIVCTNCTDDFYNRVYEYLSCSGYKLKEILTNGFIYRSLLNTRLCAEIGLNFGGIMSSPIFVSPLIRAKTRVRDPQNRVLDYFHRFLKPELTAALCNYLATSVTPESYSDSDSPAKSTASQIITSSLNQKRTIFVRLPNRIKDLETNMSLSGQSLQETNMSSSGQSLQETNMSLSGQSLQETNMSLSGQSLQELSRKYKIQVKDLQRKRTLNNTIEDCRLLTERVNLQAAQINTLNIKMDAVTSAVVELKSEKDKVYGIIIVVEVVLFLIFVICRWIGAAKSNISCSNWRASNGRHSMDNVDAQAAPKIRKPSEEACIPAGHTDKELIVDDVVKRKTSREGTRRRKQIRRRRQKNGRPESEEPVTSVAVAIKKIVKKFF